MLDRTRNGVAALAVLALAWSGGHVLAGPMSGYVGQTSPSSRESPSENFSRPEKDGGIRPVSLNPQDKPVDPTLLSGSVYYMVFERDDRDPADPWGTGIPNFLKRFRAGIDFNGGSSPDIDPNSKYLYLYQVVNHQRTLPPIESMSTKLLVDLGEITSWGHFHGLGFATTDAGGVVRPISATYKIDPRTYLSPAPALPVTQPMSIAVVPTSRGEAEPKESQKGRIVQVHWDALDPAIPPDYVMILGSSDFDKHPSFRAIWTGKNAIGKDGRSTIFGFTSPMPPTIEPVRLRTSREAARAAGGRVAEAKSERPAEKGANEAIRLAQLAEDEATAAATAIPGVEGRVPTPFPTTAEAAFNAGDAAASDGGAGFPLLPPPAPLASAGAPSFGGGGSGGASTSPQSPSGGGGGGFVGGGSGGGGTIVQQQAPAQGSGSAEVVNNIDFNVSQSNQQSQSQFQFQKQKQSQKQSQGQSQTGGGGKGNVIPEPATLVGLGMGLPALLIAYRRRTRTRPGRTDQ